jgi:hypothetical protein
LCPEEVEGVPEDAGGVYVLAAFVPSRPLLVPFYVGQSCDFRRRMNEHLKGQKSFARHLRSRLSTYFTLALVVDPALRTAAEATLIRHLIPTGNSVVPVAPLIELNLPPLSLLNF